MQQVNKRLIAFGDSNTFGHGLPDCWDEKGKGPLDIPSKLAWPETLSKLMKHQHNPVNKSWPGASNDMIWHEGLRFNYGNKDVAVFMWTYLGRMSILADNKRGHSFNGMVNWVDDGWSREILDNRYGTGSWERNKFYFENFWEEYDAHLKLVMKINHMHEFLKAKGVQSHHIWIGGGVEAEKYMLKQHENNSWNNHKWFKLFTEMPGVMGEYFQPDINFLPFHIHAPDTCIDFAADGSHPGIETHKLIAGKIKTWMDDHSCK